MGNATQVEHEPAWSERKDANAVASCKSVVDPREGVQRLTTCSTAGPMFVSVRDDRIVRIEAMEFDPDEVKSWSVNSCGKEYKPALTHPLLPWGFAGKKMAYGEERVNYPMKRVDWDPDGERNPQNRGISGYERITWDEAFDILEAEYKRILGEFGPSALCYCHSAHPEWGSLHYLFSDLFRFRDLVGGVYMEFTPNSWEGWACGAPFLWGNWMAHGLLPAEDTVQDITNHSEMIVFWGNSPIDHGVYDGIDTGRLLQYWKELGKTIVSIDPLNTETSMATDALWLPIKPGTDNALALAIAHQWIVDGTYDEEFLRTHCVGFFEGDKLEYNEDYMLQHLFFYGNMPETMPEGSSFMSYVMGKGPDGVEKTPAWAAEICSIPERKIVALAKMWAAVPTSLWCMDGGACRRTFAHENSRMMGVLSCMRGLGSPGVNILACGLSLSGPYDARRQVGPTGYADGGMNCVLSNYPQNPVNSSITFTKFKDCMENSPQEWRGGHMDNWCAERFFHENHYPEPGNSEIHLLWQRGSTLTNPPNHKRQIDAYRNSKIETFVVTAPWFDRDCRYADLVLPITTIFERQDITEPGSVGQYVAPAYSLLRSAVFSRKAIEPVAESKTDLQIFEELAERLGVGEAFNEGKNEEDILQMMYSRTNIPMNYDEFKEKGYYVWPALDDYEECKQFSKFHDNPVGPNNMLDTPTGKVEIFSTLIASYYGPDNPEIPPVPHYIPEIEGAYDDDYADYPLQMLMAHPKFRFHGKYNNISWLAENYKVYGPDGYPYEPCVMSPKDAAARGLEDGDIVRAFNDRGALLAGLVVSDRVMPGVAWLTYGSWNDPLGPESDSIDRGGDGNMISHNESMSCHHVGGSFNSVRFEVEKADLVALAAQYPEGFAGKYTTWKRG